MSKTELPANVSLVIIRLASLLYRNEANTRRQMTSGVGKGGAFVGTTIKGREVAHLFRTRELQ